MATANETRAVFRQLAQAVQVAGTSDSYSPDQHGALADAHATLSTAIRNFVDAPAEAPARNVAAVAADRAERKLATISATNLDLALDEIATATRLLVAATNREAVPVEPAVRAKPPRAVPAIQGSLRIVRQLSANGAASAAEVAQRPGAGGGGPSSYNKLVTLFPAEALTLYGSGLAIFPEGYGNKFFVLMVCVALLYFVRRLANTSRPVEGQATNVDQIAVWVAIVAFLLWATAADPEWLFGPSDLTGVTWLTVTEAELKHWSVFLGTAFVLAATAFYTPKPLPGEGAAS